MTGAQLLEPSAAASQDVHYRKLELGAEPRFKPGSLISDACIPGGGLTAAPRAYSIAEFFFPSFVTN